MRGKFNFFNNNRIYLYVIVAYLFLSFLLINISQNLEAYKNSLKEILLSESITLLDDTVNNILEKMTDKKVNFVSANLQNEELRIENEKNLAIIYSKNINSLFVVYISDEHFFFLLDADKEEPSEVHDVFIPENFQAYSDVVQNKKKKVFIQNHVDALSFTLLKPIIYNNKTVALLVIDYSKNNFTSLLNSSINIFIYLLFLVLISIFIFLSSIIYRDYKNYKAYRNFKTNTFNRNYLLDNYEKIDFKQYYIALADIDFFKQVNNRHGQKSGDEVIISVIKIMSNYLNKNDKFIEYSGEEFLLLLDKKDRSEEALKSFLEDIRMAVHQKDFEIDEDQFNITISMGVLLSTQMERSLQDVIQKADTALYEAKKTGRNRVCYYDVSQAHRVLRENLREMIESDKLVCYYQPIRDLETKALHHYEALLRIEDENMVLFPDKILPSLEDSHLYTQLTSKIIEYNIEKLRSNSKMKIAINLSANDLVNDSILSIFIQNKDLSDRLLIELLENQSIDYLKVEQSIQKLKALGFKLCIDDFGAGYANLNHLLNLSIDFLKIDGSIVQKITEDKRAYSLVKTFALFCKENNIEVIAEFIDTQEVVDILKSFGVSYGQGWYFSKAEPYEKLNKEHN